MVIFEVVVFAVKYGIFVLFLACFYPILCRENMNNNWNERFYTFNEEKTRKVLWKDASADKWVQFHDRIARHLKCLSKLGIKSQNAVIGRIIYKHHNQMRRDKPFRQFKKVHRLVKRYLDVQLVQQFMTLQTMFTELKNKSSAISSHVCIPRKEFVQYLLERTLGVSKLAVSIIVCCQNAFVHLDSHMRHGFFVPFNLFAVASVSRVWIVFKEALQTFKMLYLIMLEILGTCNHPGKNALAESRNVPQSLDDWLKDDLVGVLPTIQHIKEEEAGPSVTPAPPLSSDATLFTDSSNLLGICKDIEDFGEPVSLNDTDLIMKLATKFEEATDQHHSQKENEDLKDSNECETSVCVANGDDKNDAKTDEFPQQTENNLFHVEHVVEASSVTNAVVPPSLDHLAGFGTNLLGRRTKRLKCPLCGIYINKRTFSLSRPFKRDFYRYINDNHSFTSLIYSYTSCRRQYKKKSISLESATQNRILRKDRRRSMRAKRQKMLFKLKKELYWTPININNVKHILLHSSDYRESQHLLLHLRILRKRKRSSKN